MYVLFDETKYLVTRFGRQRFVKFTTVARNVRFCPYTRWKTLTPFVNCIVNDAVVHNVSNVQQTLLQLVNAVQLPLMQLLLDVAPYLVIDRILRSALFGSHRSWRMKLGVDCSRNRTVSHAQCVGALFC